MNKKEVAEIRRILTKDHCRIDRISACYVNSEKDKVMTMLEAFFSLPEESVHKYCDLFKKTLSGRLGKNLTEMEFPMNEEAEGGSQHFLMQLRDCALKDESLLSDFYDRIIESYATVGNYLIILAYGVYDIPARTTDQDELFDASEYMYSFLLCSICPVKLSSPGLCYDSMSNSFIEKLQDHMVNPPENGFLFPCFTDRNTDIHHVLYYAKNDKLIHEELTEAFLRTRLPLPSSAQKNIFNAMIEETLGHDCSYDTVKNLHENLNALLAEEADSLDPLFLDSSDVGRLLAQSGATEEQVAESKAFLEEHAEDHLLAANLASPKKFDITTEDLKLQIKTERIDLIETRMIDGRECLVIPLTDEIQVNGIRIRQRLESSD